MSDVLKSKAYDGTPSAIKRRSAVRRVPVWSDLPLDLPITSHEIHMVLDALGPEIATLFEEDE